MSTIAVYIEIMKTKTAGILSATRVVNFSFMEMHTKPHKKSTNRCHVDDDFCHWTNIFNLIHREKALRFSIEKGGNGNKEAFTNLETEKKKKEDNPEGTPFLYSANLFIQKFDGVAPESTAPKHSDKGVLLTEVQVTEAILDSGNTYSFELIGAKATFH